MSSATVHVRAVGLKISNRSTRCNQGIEMNDRVFRASEAARLDSPERLIWLPPDEVIEKLALRPGMVVADIGAGTGYFALPMAWQVAPDGAVYAVDMQVEMLAILRAKLAVAQVDNVLVIQGEAARTGLQSSSCDLLLLANIWHELDDLPAVVAECRRILRPAGRIAILDWRPDVSQPPGPPLHHRIPAHQVAKLLTDSGWSSVGESQVGAYSYLVVASPTGANSPAS